MPARHSKPRGLCVLNARRTLVAASALLALGAGTAASNAHATTFLWSAAQLHAVVAPASPPVLQLLPHLSAAPPEQAPEPSTQPVVPSMRAAELLGWTPTPSPMLQLVGHLNGGSTGGSSSGWGS